MDIVMLNGGERINLAAFITEENIERGDISSNKPSFVLESFGFHFELLWIGFALI